MSEWTHQVKRTGEIIKGIYHPGEACYLEYPIHDELACTRLEIDLIASFPPVKALVAGLDLIRSTLKDGTNPPSDRMRWALETIDEILAPLQEPTNADR